jgi:dihydroorotase
VHRLALRRAATSGDAKFFLGTDTAPHPIHDKERDCGCAGIFSAPAALEIYAGIFAEEQALDRFEAFASLNGPRFYGLPPNEPRVTLARRPWRVPATVATEAGALHPFCGGEDIAWQLLP